MIRQIADPVSTSRPFRSSVGILHLRVLFEKETKLSSQQVGILHLSVGLLFEKETKLVDVSK